MLAFMRKYQKYFYGIITFVIILSFSFFGTYNTLDGNSIHEQVAFTTVEGEDISRAELEEMAQFIGTDREDKKMYGGIWGPNFLNDGVIRKDFLETGLAEDLVLAYKGEIREDLKLKSIKERAYKPYEHPQAPFVSSINAWSYFAPTIKQNLDALQKSTDPVENDALQSRINLYLSEKRFPSPYLKQMLVYQEKQNSWIPHDENLDYQDLSLFGYHSLDDWFGNRFSKLIAQFIFNAAAIAEANGYIVTKEEALSNLMENAEASFKENLKSPWLGVANSNEYFNQQLLRMHLDKTKAVKLWQKVLLFRKLFDDIGQAIFVDPNIYTAFNGFANEVLTGDLYRLPPALKFSDLNSLIRFETYLDAVAKRSKDEKTLLDLPTTFASPEIISQKYPELVRKRYEIEMAKTSKKALQAKVTVKETLKWELDEKNWNELKKTFPELALLKISSKEERINAFDQIDSVTRGRIDQFARQKIVETHPEWIEDTLKNAPLKEESISLSPQTPSSYFIGLDKGDQLMKILDQAPLNTESDALKAITFDNENYYKMIVTSRSPQLEVISFEEANRSGLLDDIADKTLEIAYVQLRSQDPSTFQNSDKSWKKYQEVREKVALAYYAKTLTAIKNSLKSQPDKEKYQNLQNAQLGAYRFVGPAQNVLETLKKSPEKLTELTLNEEEPTSKATLTQQFKWIRSQLQLSRKNDRGLFDTASLFQLQPNQWSLTKIAPNGDVFFTQVKNKKADSATHSIQQEQIARARFLLGRAAEREYLQAILPLIKEKHSISFDYLNAGKDMIEPENA